MAITAHDIVSDSPTNNFATMNPLAYRYGHNGIQYSNGNLRVVQGTSAITYATFTTKSGKWYWEIFIENNGTVVNSDYRGLAEPVLGQSSDGWGNDCFLYNSYNGTYKIDAGSFTASDIGTANNPDIIGFFWDADNGYMTVSVNGVSGTTITGLSTGIPMCPAVACNYDTIDIINFGQDPTFGGNKNTPATVNGETGPFAPSGDAEGTAGLFYYPPPADAKALCTANLPDFTPDVTGDVPQDYFKAVLYTGQTADSTFVDNGDGTWSKTGVGFQPDLVWAKARSASYDALIFDAIRGSGKSLTPSSAASELTNSGNGYLSAFNSDGFEISSGSFGVVSLNESGVTYVAWCWKAAGSPSGSTSTTGSAKRINISGTQDDTSCSALATAATNAGASNVITPTLISINQAAGFSIVKWQASNGSDKTVPHGLSNSLDMIVMKNLDTGTYGWFVSHVGLTTNHNVLLNAPDESWNPATGGWVEVGTGGVFNIKNGTNGTNTNNATDNYIAYCWHSVEGYSKFGSYTGNGSADGPFVYCGFRPAWIMIKQSSTSGNSWWITDSARYEFNGDTPDALRADTPDEENTGNSAIMPDYLSNGFKIRGADSAVNLSSSTYIFMAFAEQPFKFSNAR